MPSRVANESEHRRGLVLGLTLAEILILLLFLILLVLGARLIKVGHALTELNPLLIELRKDRDLGIIDARKLVVELARVKELDKLVSDLREKNLRINSELVDKNQRLASFEKLVAAAKLVNPNDPPAVLKIALEAFEVIGLKVDQVYWKYLSEVIAKFDSAEKSVPVAERDQFHQALVAFLNAGRGPSSAHMWPPIIRLSDADKNSFTVGSAELAPDFEKKIREIIIPQLLSMSKEYQVDVIEVVGHTDEQPISSRVSNLDKELLSVFRGEREIKTLVPADNAGLGLTRAVAVVEALRKDKSLDHLRILPLSGAQLIQLNETLSKGAIKADERERRRIEIRLRKSN